MEKRKTPMGFLNATKFESELMCNDKSSSTYLVEKERFMKDLLQFHTQRGLSFNRIPRLNGKSLDLYNLYLSVTRNGGWEKVTNEEKWFEVMASLDLNKSCGNADFALRQIYIKYLHHYEKVHFFGQEVDVRDDQNENEDAPRKKAIYQVGGVTFSYNHQQHNISDPARESLGVARDPNLFFNPNYASLEKSLASGLPNEIDFAINVCLLMSNDTKHVLKGPKSLKVVELLLSHVGIFKQGPCAYTWEFENDTNLNFQEFWNETVGSKGVLQLMYPDNMLNDKDIPAVELNPQPEDEGNSIFCQRRQIGIREREGQRVIQVAHIVRNFLVEDENIEILASSMALYRFLMLCTYNSFGSIRQLGLDGLSYLSSKLILDPAECRMTRLILQLISRCILSVDKFEIIRGCDLISQLSLCNEEDLSLDESLYPVLIRLLTIHDLELLLASLEALYQLSENGHTPCNAIVSVHKSIDTLLSLLTIDAQKQLLTPDLLECGAQPEPILSPVVNFNPIFHQIILPGNLATTMPQNVVQATIILPTNNMNPNVSSMPVIVSASNVAPQMNLSAINVSVSNNAVTNGMAATASGSVAVTTPEDPSVVKPSEPVPPQTASMIANFTENEKTAFNWLTSQYEFVSGSEVGLSKMEMFRKYISESSVHGLQKVVSPTSFENCIKAAFPHSKIVSKNNSMDFSFCGIVKKVHQAPKPSATTSFPAIEQVLTQKTSSTDENLLEGIDKDLVSVAADVGIEIISDPPTKEPHAQMDASNPLQAELIPSQASGLNPSLQQAFLATSSTTGTSLPIGISAQHLLQKQLVLQKINNTIPTSLVPNQAVGQTAQPKQQLPLNASVINSVLVQQSRFHPPTTNSGGLSILQAQLLKQAFDSQRLASPSMDAKSPLPSSSSSSSPPPSDSKKRKIVSQSSPLVRQIKKKKEETNGPAKYYCKWTGCEGLVFDKFSAIYQHIVKQHFEKHSSEGTMVCLWSGCDGMPRQKWSFMAHILERHLNENMLRLWSTKHIEPSTCIPTHPPSTMYPHNAALQAIRRFSARPPFAEFMDAKEESTSKHIHLTAALILRNLARYSAQARSLIKKHESRVAFHAFSDTESSCALSSCLYELHHFIN